MANEEKNEPERGGERSDLGVRRRGRRTRHGKETTTDERGGGKKTKMG